MSLKSVCAAWDDRDQCCICGRISADSLCPDCAKEQGAAEFALRQAFADCQRLMANREIIELLTEFEESL